ncbi:MAG: PilZ domain-containing protein [Acetobacterales bacterium]
MPGFLDWFFKARARDNRMGRDRRRHDRYTVTGVAAILFGARERVYDISMGGLCIRPYEGGLKAGSVFSFELELKMHNSDSRVKLTCRGKVVRRVDDLLALKYVAMEDPLKRHLQDFIRRFEEKRPDKPKRER